MKVRSLLAVALAALLVPAAASAAPVKQATRSAPTTSPGMQGLSIGGFIGYETDDVDGLSLRFDGELPFQALSPQVNLSWVGSLGYSRLSEDLGRDLDFTVNVIKIIPAARFSFPLSPELSLFADAGLGLYYADWTIDTDFGFGRTEVDDSELSLLMRFGGGAFYQINPQTRLGAMIEFDPYFGDFDQTTFIIQGGAMFQL